MERVIGVDACKQGWVGFTSDSRGYFGQTISELVALADRDGHVAVVAIDIPIGLPTIEPRQADLPARSLVGKRASSVFPTPVRAALSAPTHSEATAINETATGKGLRQQAYALRHKILEVDAWARSAGRTSIEVHPELCFATMAHKPLEHPKSTWAGAEKRRRLLTQAGLAHRLTGGEPVSRQASMTSSTLQPAAGRPSASPKDQPCRIRQSRRHSGTSTVRPSGPSGSRAA